MQHVPRKPILVWHPARTSRADRAGILTGAVGAAACTLLLGWALLMP